MYTRIVYVECVVMMKVVLGVEAGNHTTIILGDAVAMNITVSKSTTAFF